MEGQFMFNLKFDQLYYWAYNLHLNAINFMTISNELDGDKVLP